MSVSLFPSLDPFQDVSWKCIRAGLALAECK